MFHPFLDLLFGVLFLCTLRPVVQFRTQGERDVGQWTKNRQFAKPALCSIIARKTNRVVQFKLLNEKPGPIIRSPYKSGAIFVADVSTGS
ncbi:hypothetical protein Pfl01_4906 [Pseudomonas fluorescens Pf0-1]|uniref:Uncharacterized protein n=1 Tax=Pseudomonas fluorescens (strain Pf0-1) TaxID=205922 RepID=Q3K6G1_PSEPF|nr:hypothetical protein Pfl01_4906 [Pseudomonas fluorescens Pf0-1]